MSHPELEGKVAAVELLMVAALVPLFRSIHKQEDRADFALDAAVSMEHLMTTLPPEGQRAAVETMERLLAAARGIADAVPA